MIPRRDLLEGLFKTGMAAIGSSVVGGDKGQPTQANTVSQHKLPPIPLEHWTMTVVEMNYPAGSCTCTQRPAGFVVGYVLEGEIRFQMKGHPEKTYRAGQVFYEPPDGARQVSTNASKVRPARFLALVFSKPESA